MWILSKTTVEKLELHGKSHYNVDLQFCIVHS